MSLSAIKKRAAAMRPDLPLQDVVEYLARNWRGPGTEYLAYEILKAIGPLGLRELHAALSLLEPLDVLQHKWTIEGPAGWLHVRDDHVNSVLAGNDYLHPATGEIVINAALKLVLRYEPGAALNDLMRAEEPAA